MVIFIFSFKPVWSHFSKIFEKSALYAMFLVGRLLKRICCDDVICQKCRSQYLKWRQNMEGDFDRFDSFNQLDVESVNNDDNSVRNRIFYDYYVRLFNR
jgi:hypothetical protein